jgi:hypothetical protein
VGQLAVQVRELAEANGVVGMFGAGLGGGPGADLLGQRESFAVTALPEQLGDLLIELCDRFRHKGSGLTVP